MIHEKILGLIKRPNIKSPAPQKKINVAQNMKEKYLSFVQIATATNINETKTSQICFFLLSQIIRLLLLVGCFISWKVTPKFLQYNLFLVQNKVRLIHRLPVPLSKVRDSV